MFSIILETFYNTSSDTFS